MSQKTIAVRYSLIIGKLRQQKNATFREINDYLQQQSELKGEDLTISKRTFVRDMANIGEVYGIYIKYDYSARSYFIEDDLSEEKDKRRLEALDIFNALKIKERHQNRILLDSRKNSGTEYIYGLLSAINNNLQVTFFYQKFHEEEGTMREVNPLAIKEFRLRWFLLALDRKDNKIKTFGLDRISYLDIQNNLKFKSEEFDGAEYLKYAFGITVVNDEEPEEVILSFTPIQGKYIKTLPLHSSQKVIIDDETEFRISLKICLTHDFKMELLSMGENVKVISPQRLIDDIKSTYERALGNYL